MNMRQYALAAAILAHQSSLFVIDAYATPLLLFHRLGSSGNNSRLLHSTKDHIESKRTEWSLNGPSTSLIPETIDQMEKDIEFQELAKKISKVGVEGMTKEERAKRRRALEDLGVPNFMQFVVTKDGEDHVQDSHIKNNRLYRSQPTILQLNIGLYCNQACSHCHVESSPLRKEETMSANVAARCLELLQNSPTIDTLDLTGGAPELNEQFRFLVKMARQWAIENMRKLTIIDRCNLTVLLEPNQEDLVDFLKENRVKVVASLPCYGEDNVDKQRGRGVFQRSIAALHKLNEAGYGSSSSSDLELDLVYNPSGAFLPPSQHSLEGDYKRELLENFGIKFNNLITITNMPIKRFADSLAKQGQMKQYMELLVNNYNPKTVGGLMCLNTISVGWDGSLFDCDFNQQLNMGIVGLSDDSSARKKLSVFDIDCLTDLEKYSVMTDNHCFGCTAGSGSSCQGATV
jgi:radical SAM/Cys-rich protein